MATLNYLTGFEWPGVSTPVSTGLGLVAAVTGTPSVTASAARSGSYGLRCSAAGSSQNIDVTVTGGLAAGRVYVRLTDYPTPNGTQLIRLGSTADHVRVYVNTDGSVHVNAANGGSDISGPVLNTGQWYRIDFAFDTSGTTRSAKAWLDGSYLGEATKSGVAADADTTLTIGPATAASTWEVDIDDVIVSSTLGDAPFGDGRVLAYVPSGAASHQSITLTEWATTSDFSSFTDFTASNESTSAPLLDDLTAGTDGIQVQGGAGAVAGNARWAIALLSGSDPGTVPDAVRGIAVHQDEASGTNNIIERIELSGSTSNIFSGNPAASWEYKAAIFTTAPGGGAWTNANLDSLNIEVDSTDSNPDTFIGGIVLEVAFPDVLLPALVTARR